MTLIKKRDVPAHFAARRRNPNQIHIVPASLPDITGLSDKEPNPVDTNPLKLNRDLITDHSSIGTSPASAVDLKAPEVRQFK
jgi:hypothetical protein